MRVAVVGVGAMGRIQVDSYLDDDRTAVRGLCDISAEALSEAARRCPEATVTSDLAVIATDTSIDLVSVCLPHVDHVPTATTLLEADKRVVLEKPIAMNCRDAARLLKASSARPGALVVKSYLRHTRSCQLLHAAVADGLIGSPRLVTSSFASLRRDEGVPRWRLRSEESGGGALLDSGIHLIDFLHWTFGTERTVTASLRTDESGIDLDDVVTLEFEHGPLAVITLTQRSNVSGPCFRIEVFGDSGRALVETTPSGEMHFRAEVGTERRPDRIEAGWWLAAHRAALGTYVDRVSRGEPFDEENPEDAALNVATVDAAYHVAAPAGSQ